MLRLHQLPALLHEEQLTGAGAERFATEHHRDQSKVLRWHQGLAVHRVENVQGPAVLTRRQRLSVLLAAVTAVVMLPSSPAVAGDGGGGCVGNDCGAWGTEPGGNNNGDT